MDIFPRVVIGVLRIGDFLVVGCEGAAQSIGVGRRQNGSEPLDTDEYVGVPARRRGRATDRHGGGDADKEQIQRQRAEQ